ncbi:TPA: hypothetical protein ACH3X3_003371 [Trebouxia sp. C0006]
MCKHQACRQRLTWLQPCRRQTAAGAFSFSRKRFSQLQTGCCNAKAARPHKQQEKSMQPGLPDISELSPQLQQEWHPDNNALLGGIKVNPGSGLRVMWSCPNFPAGCPHIWKATVSSRTRGAKCPYCQGRSVCQHSSLATNAPRQTSNQEGRNTKRPTFEAVQHPLLLEWDYERNAADGIHPNNTTLGSNTLVHWDCQKCSQGQVHKYQMRSSNRAGKQASGCPYYAGKQVCKCNSLETHYPIVSSEWDFAKK